MCPSQESPQWTVPPHIGANFLAPQRYEKNNQIIKVKLC